MFLKSWREGRQKPFFVSANTLQKVEKGQSANNDYSK
jgi:hypothetical protein